MEIASLGVASSLFASSSMRETEIILAKIEEATSHRYQSRLFSKCADGYAHQAQAERYAGDKVLCRCCSGVQILLLGPSEENGCVGGCCHKQQLAIGELIDANAE